MAVDYHQIAIQAATQAGIDPAIFVRQIQQESGFQPHVGSPAGAQGIAQIMPSTARAWGVNPQDPVASLHAAAGAMAKYLHSYNGDWHRALAAYNAGPGAVAQYNGVPPYAETRHYVATILGGQTPQTGSPSGMAPQAPQNGSYAPQNSIAVSNQANRIMQAYGEAGASDIGESKVKNLYDSVTTGLAAPQQTGTAGQHLAAEGAGFFHRNPGETFQVYMDRLLQQRFGLQHDPGNSQTTGGHHANGSAHHVGGATDYGNARNPTSTINQAVSWANQHANDIVGFDHTIWQAAGHYDHAHFEGREGQLHKGTPQVTPVNPPTQTRPVGTRRPVKSKRAPK